MSFIKYELGYLNGGETVEITLDRAANVLLLDSSNFSNYRSGRKYTYNGGHAKHSPSTIAVPRSGTWYIAIDLGGGSGTIRSSVRII